MSHGPERSTSIRFTEEMKGHVSFGEPDHERGPGKDARATLD